MQVNSGVTEIPNVVVGDMEEEILIDGIQRRGWILKIVEELDILTPFPFNEGMHVRTRCFLCGVPIHVNLSLRKEAEDAGPVHIEICRLCSVICLHVSDKYVGEPHIMEKRVQ